MADTIRILIFTIVNLKLYYGWQICICNVAILLIYFSILIRFVIGIEQLGDKVHHQKQHSHLHTPTGFHWTWVTPKWLACHHNQHKFCKLMNMRDYHLQQQPTTISNNHIKQLYQTTTQPQIILLWTDYLTKHPPKATGHVRLSLVFQHPTHPLTSYFITT